MLLIAAALPIREQVMLVPLERYVDEPEFRRLLLKHFPELEEDIELNEGLIHVEMGALGSLADNCIRSGDMAGLKKIYEFVGDLARHQKMLHPDLINAIHVSFLEDLIFRQKPYGERAKALLPPVLREMWENVMAFNRALIGGEWSSE